MKSSLLIIVFTILTSSFDSSYGQGKIYEQTPKEKNKKISWKLIFEDNFTQKGSFNKKKWSYSPRWHPSWAKFLTASTDYVYQENGNLFLRMDNKKIEGDSIPYHSGGIQTSQKFSFLYGKVEVRAKFNKGKGSWPAIWMIPEAPHKYGDWPKSGEIDIMEHVNNEDIVHQTIHSQSETDDNGGSISTKTSNYNINDYNIYSIIWEKNRIEFYVNNRLQYTYHKADKTTYEQWPFDVPFYIILNQSGGAGWPGPIDNKDLPFEMKVDYVRVYQKEK